MDKKKVAASFITGLIENDYTRKWARKLLPKVKALNERLAQ